MPDEHGFFPPPTRSLGLPSDTPTYLSSEVQLFLTAAGDGKLQGELALFAAETGWYRFVFDAATFKDLLSQATVLSSMTPERTKQIARELHENTNTEGDGHE